MTVLVGVRCSNGVVIGSDSAITYGIAPTEPMTAEASQGGIKIAVVAGDVLVASSGEVGLAQRLVLAFERAFQGQVPNLPNVRAATPVECGTLLAQVAGSEFIRTRRPWENHFGIAALVGVVLQDEARLINFDAVTFRPELVGERDAQGTFITLPLATTGSGQRQADPFLLHAHRVLFGETHFPTTAEGRLLVAYTLDHVIRYNPGMVGGDPHVATLESSGTHQWVVRHSALDEIRQQVQTLEAHIRAHVTAAPAEVPDLAEALAEPPAAAQTPPTAGS